MPESSPAKSQTEIDTNIFYALSNLSNALIDSPERIEQTLPHVLEQICTALSFKGAILYTLNEYGTSLETFISTFSDNADKAIEIDADEPIELIADNKNILLPEEGLANSLCIPLLFKEIPYGVVCFCGRETPINIEVETILKTVTHQLTIAIYLCFTELYEPNNDYEVIAEMPESDSQGEIISESTPDMVDFSASLQLLRGVKGGGDFHDFLHLPNNKIAITIGKSSGWGEKVEKMLELIIPQVREELTSGKPLHEVVSLLNESIIEKSGRGILVSIAMMILDTRTRKVTITRAGSVRMLRFKAGKLSVFDEGLGPHLGAFSGVKIKEVELQFAPGDSFAVMTDGICTLSEHDQFSLDQLTHNLSSCMEVNQETQIADKIAELLKERHTSYTPELDITVFSLQRLRKPKSISQRLIRKR